MPRISGKSDIDGLLIDVGAVVRAERISLQMSQETLADVAEIDRSHMGRIERGQRNLTLLNLAKVAKAIGLKPSELLAKAGI